MKIGQHLSAPKSEKELRTIMPPTTYPKTVLEQIKQDVAYSRSQSRPDAQAAVMTSISLLEQLVARVELLEWVKARVRNIDFSIDVPPGVMCSQPWIALGSNFEEAVAKARDQFNALPVAKGKSPFLK